MMRRFLRELVLRTNQFGPLQHGYGAIYRTAVASFLNYVARNRPMVRSVYLRRSQNGQKWTPGLSDIDLTVILAAPSSPEAEHRLLEDFWAAYSRIKRLFPMFGEVEVLAQHEFGSWVAKTSYSPGRRPWELIYGEVDAALDVDATLGWQLRALRLAWWIYEDLLSPCVAQPDSLVRNRDIQRRVDKIFRLLAPVLREAGWTEPGASHRNPADMVASALEALESVAVHLLPVQRTQRQEGPNSTLFQSRLDEGQMLVVEDGLDREALARFILKNRPLRRNAPLLLSRCLLEYRVRFYDPYDYSVLSSDWTAATGPHPLEHVRPPGEPEFLQYLLDRLRNLQVASRGEELFTNNLTVDQVGNTLLTVVALRILQDGRLIPSRNEIAAVEFPEYGRAVGKIGGLIGEGRQSEARRGYFFLLRSIMNQLATLLDTPVPVPRVRVMNETLPSVSVVVPVYNGATCVEKTVRSLLALTYPRDRVELIVVDNASTDGTARILTQFAGQIRVLTEPKRGRSNARNRGIAAATHEVVAFTDVDCIADSEWLRHLVTSLSDPHTGICGGRIVTMRPCTPIEEFGESLWEQNHAINVFKPPYAISANWASPKRVLVEAGGFDAAFERGEDVDLAYRIFQAGYSITYSENAVIQHRNPQNIEGLFKLGFLHGFYSVKVLKQHRRFLQQFGHRRIWLGSYRLLVANLMDSVRKGSDPMRLYDAVFNLGKKAGKLSGSIRFGYLEL